MSKKVHIILAGGIGSRFGTLTKGVAKTVMPLGNTTLLYRQLTQSLETDDTRIIIGTNPLYLKQINRSVLHYPNVSVESKNFSPEGPLSTLNNMLKDLPPRTKVMLTLGDIYFRQNPFNHLFQKNINADLFLAGSKAFAVDDLEMGGVVFTEHDIIKSVVKKPIPGNKKGYKWSGTAIFEAAVQKDLNKFLKEERGRELEDFFDYYRSLGHLARFIETSDFINVNTIEDFHIATLYNLSELYANGKQKMFASIADELRRAKFKKRKQMFFINTLRRWIVGA